MTCPELRGTNPNADKWVSQIQGPLASPLSSLWHSAPALMTSPPRYPVGFSNTCQNPNSLLSSPLKTNHSSSSCLFNYCPHSTHPHCLPWKLSSPPWTFLLSPATFLRVSLVFHFWNVSQSSSLLPVVTGTAQCRPSSPPAWPTLIFNSLIHSVSHPWTSAMG